jgi:hypothetical protein
MLQVEVRWQQRAGTQSHLVVEAEMFTCWRWRLPCSRAPNEMRSVIRFLNAEGAKPVAIYTRMLAKYGASCMSKTQVYEWVQKFKNGVQSVEDSPRPGQAHRVVTPIWLRQLTISYKKIAALQLVKFHWRWRLDALRGRHFRPDEEVKEAVHDWLA